MTHNKSGGHKGSSYSTSRNDWQVYATIYEFQ